MNAESAPPTFYFDSYALVERQRGNPSYERFREFPIITHQWNLYEFAYKIAKEVPMTLVRSQLEMLAPNLVEADQDDILNAVAFRLTHRVKNLSYVDALGYTLARRHGKKFLTGDSAFEDVPGVEFVR